MPISSLLWGTNFENQVSIGYSLFDVLTDHEEREGSVHIQGPSGAEDSWIVGRDYVMDAEVRWIPDGPNTNPVQTQLSGPVSWQEFIDWSRDANAFRFVPDVTVPDFYVDNVYLVEPRKGFGSLSGDIKRNVKLKLRNATKDFHEALRGIMFEYAPGAIEATAAATFLRTGAATRRGRPGTLISPVGASDASGVLRDRHYEGTLKTALLEAARTQLIADPENLAAASWTAVTITRTGGQADPFGGTAAYLLTNTAAGGANYATAGFAVDATKSVLVAVRRSNNGICEFGISDDTAGVWRHRVRVTFDASGAVTGVTTVGGAGLITPAVNFGGGWWVIGITANGVVAANLNRLYLYPDSFGVGGSASAATYFFGPNAWNATFPSSYQGPSLGTRNTEQLSWPFTYVPQPMFALVEFVERGTILSATSGTWLWQIGRDGAPTREWIGYQGAGDYRSYHNNGVAAVFISAVARPNIGDFVQQLHILNPDGSVKLIQAINGGAPVSAGPSAANSPFAADWGLATLRLNATEAPAGVGFNAFGRMKIAPLTYGGLTRDTIPKALAA